MATKLDRGRYAYYAGRNTRRQNNASFSPSFHLNPRHSSYGAPTVVTRILLIVGSLLMLFYTVGVLFSGDGRTPSDGFKSSNSAQLKNANPPSAGVYAAPIGISGEKEQETLQNIDNGLAPGAPVDQKSVTADDTNDSSKPASLHTSTRRKRATAFMVVFLGHSGSTAFITEMRGHPEFEIEELEPVDHFEYERDTDLAIKYIREILDRAVAKGKVAGFKIRPYHIRHNTKAWQDLANEYDIRIFWNFRENVVKQAIGEYRHRVLNDTSVVEGLKDANKACDEKSGYKCQFSIDNVKAVHELMNEFSINDEYLAEAVRMLKRDDHMMVVKYEDYLYRRERLMREVMDFLGVDYSETQSLRTKASLDSLCDMVTNYQEVCSSFYPCQLWRPFLDDERNDCYCRGSNSLQFDPKLCVRKVWHQNTDE